MVANGTDQHDGTVNFMGMTCGMLITTSALHGFMHRQPNSSSALSWVLFPVASCCPGVSWVLKILSVRFHKESWSFKSHAVLSGVLSLALSYLGREPSMCPVHPCHRHGTILVIMGSAVTALHCLLFWGWVEQCFETVFLHLALVVLDSL